MECPACQRANPEGATACVGCGATLPTRCAQCGEPLPARSRFCLQCGAAVAAGLPPPRASEHDERRQLTVMFCDLAESTWLSERLDPEDLLDVVRRYQAVVAGIVERYGGYVAQYLGDGVLVYFGYPLAYEDDARRAVTSGLEILAAVARLSETLEAERGVTISLRVGLHTGTVVAGEVGSGARTEQLAMGATPNVAARVQALAEPGELLLSDASYRLVERFFEFASLGPRTLRGVSEPVVVHRALRQRSGEPAAEHARDEGSPPFVGRARELAILREALDCAERGEGRVVLLSGEPGIGKTRLHQELSRRAQGRIAAWLGCTCSAYHRNSALHPIIEQLARTVGLMPGEEAKESLARLESWIESLELPVPETAPPLAALLSLPTEGYEVVALSPERQRQQLLSVLINLVRHLARRKPVVLVMEDLQWADPSTRELLQRLAAEIEHEKVLAIFAYRPEAEADWSALPRASRLELGRLEPEEAGAMLDRWVELPPGVRREVLARTDGIPLFLEELTRAVVADGAKRVEGAGRRGAAAREPLIPATLHSSLIARLDGLGPAKETAQLAALLGRTFRHDLLRTASPLEPRILEEHLERLVGAGLLERVGSPRDAAYHFRQSLIQETAYESLLRSRRRQLHEHVAVALGEAFPDLARTEPETLARHYEAAGRWPEAARLQRSAGGRAVERGAYVEAIASFRKALELLEHLAPGDERNREELGLLQLLVVPIFAHHGYAAPELPRIYASIRELTRDLGGAREEAWQLLTSWAFHLVRSDRTETHMLADEMIALAARAPEVLGDAQLGYVLGYNAFYSGDQPRALRELARAMAPAEGAAESPLSFAEAAFHASLARGWCLAVLGRGEAAWQMLEASVAAAEAVGQPFALAQALAYMAAVAQEAGRDPRELQAIAERLLKIAVEQDLQIWICFGHIFRGWARALLGEEDGVVELRGAIEASLAGGHLTSMGHSLLMLATALGQLGRTREALEAVERALDFGAKHLERFSVADAQRVRGELLELLGERAAAESSLRAALATAREQGARLFGLRAATSLARLLQEQGRLDEARACLAPWLTELGEGDASAWRREAEAVLAGLDAPGVPAAR